MVTTSIPTPPCASKQNTPSQQWPRHKAHLMKYNTTTNNKKKQKKKHPIVDCSSSKHHMPPGFRLDIFQALFCLPRVPLALCRAITWRQRGGNNRGEQQLSSLSGNKPKMAHNAGETATAVILLHAEMLKLILCARVCVTIEGTEKGHREDNVWWAMSGTHLIMADHRDE